jgi:hypothetical protein
MRDQQLQQRGRQALRKVSTERDSSGDEDSQSEHSAPVESASQNEEQRIREEEEAIKQQLKNLPYEVLLQHRQQLAHSRPAPLHPTPKQSRLPPKSKAIEKAGKKERDAAVELNIHKRTPKRTKDIFEPARKKSIDPRFESYAGSYNQDLAMKSYGFIPQLQKAEISELRKQLKSSSKRHKITPDQREVLSREYNRVTSEFKRVELQQLEQQTKRELKQKAGPNYQPKQHEIRREFEKRKFEGLSEADRERKLNEKQTQIQRQHLSERRKTLHMSKH